VREKNEGQIINILSKFGIENYSVEILIFLQLLSSFIWVLGGESEILKLGIQNVIYLQISGNSNFSRSLMFIRGDILMCTLSPIIFIAIAILF
jgi:hypothetical protein